MSNALAAVVVATTMAVTFQPPWAVAQEARVTTVRASIELASNGRLGGVSVAPDGSLIVANFGRSVWRIAPDGTTTVLAATMQGSSGNTVDPDGHVLQGSWLDDRVVRIAPDGATSTFADGLEGPVGIVLDDDDNAYICNCKGNYITRVAADGTKSRFAESEFFACPNGITIDENGDLFVVSFDDAHVVRIEPDGTTHAVVEIPDGKNAHIARVGDWFYVTKIETHWIYRFDRSGTFERFAGTGERGASDGTASEATIAHPNGIAAGADGRSLYFNTLVGPWRGDEVTRLVIRRIELPD